jgi:medium-chain acyl-[acyl-carrier-protein] hydrolase
MKHNIESWFSPLRRNPKSELRLFCLPYAGGSAAIYRSWYKQLPEFLDIWPIELPGRGQRITESPVRNLAELTDSIAEELKDVFSEKPFALFGHSMGATVAFEVARKLYALRRLSPLSLFVSGRQAPHIADRTPPTYNVSDGEFIENLCKLNGTPREVIQHPDLLSLLLPVLRADFQAIQTYEWSHSLSAPLLCPIRAFGGVTDVHVAEGDIRAWRAQTKGAFSLHMLPGDHFFIHSQQNALVNLVGKYLGELR